MPNHEHTTAEHHVSCAGNSTGKDVMLQHSNHLWEWLIAIQPINGGTIQQGNAIKMTHGASSTNHHAPPISKIKQSSVMESSAQGKSWMSECHVVWSEETPYQNGFNFSQAALTQKADSDHGSFWWIIKSCFPNCSWHLRTATWQWEQPAMFCFFIEMQQQLRKCKNATGCFRTNHSTLWCEHEILSLTNSRWSKSDEHTFCNFTVSGQWVLKFGISLQNCTSDSSSDPPLAFLHCWSQLTQQQTGAILDSCEESFKKSCGWLIFFCCLTDTLFTHTCRGKASWIWKINNIF